MLELDTRKTFGLALLVALALSFLAPSTGLPDRLGANRIIEANTTFLEGSRQAAHYDAVLIGEVLAVTEIIASASVGVEVIARAEVSVGKALAAVNLTLRDAFVVALASSSAHDILLKLTTVSLLAAGTLSKLALGLAALWALWPQSILRAVHVRLIAPLARISVSGFLALYLVLPYAVNLSAWVLSSQSVPIAEHRVDLHALHADVLHSHKMTDLKAWAEGNKVHSELQTVARNSSKMVSTANRYVVAQATDAVVYVLVLPLFVFGVLWVFLHRALPFGRLQYLQKRPRRPA